MAVSVLSEILRTQIVAIIRGANPKDVLRIAAALIEGGVTTLEITLNSPKALSVIEEAARQIGDRALVGAGTVLDAEAAKEAIAAGAKFIISPIVDVETIKMTKVYGAVSIPGAYSPTEILKAYRNGGDLYKSFPGFRRCYVYQRHSWSSDHIPLMPTGGVNLENIAEFKKAGAVAFGIGSALVNTKNEITEEYLQELTIRARKFRQSVSSSQ